MVSQDAVTPEKPPCLIGAEDTPSAFGDVVLARFQVTLQVDRNGISIHTYMH